MIVEAETVDVRVRTDSLHFGHVPKGGGGGDIVDGLWASERE